MGGSDPPPAYSNPEATTQRQDKENITAAAATQQANLIGQTSPFGSLSYTQYGTGIGGIPLYNATTQLSPEMQAIVTALQGGITGQLGMADYGNKSPTEAIGGPTSGLTQWMMNNQVGYLQPFFTQQQENLDNQLRNQGIMPGSPAYQRSMNNLSQSQGQTVTGALNQIEQTAFGQAAQLYGMPMQVAGQLYGMLNPDFFTKSLVNPAQTKVDATNYANIVNAYNQYQMDAYKQQVAQQTAMWQAAGQLGGLALAGFTGSPAGSGAILGGLGRMFGSGTAGG